MFLFAFSAFARIVDIVSSNGHLDDIIQLSDVIIITQLMCALKN